MSEIHVLKLTDSELHDLEKIAQIAFHSLVVAQVDAATVERLAPTREKIYYFHKYSCNKEPGQ